VRKDDDRRPDFPDLMGKSSHPSRCHADISQASERHTFLLCPGQHLDRPVPELVPQSWGQIFIFYFLNTVSVQQTNSNLFKNKDLISIHPNSQYGLI
jgi:hypothetical protein